MSNNLTAVVRRIIEAAPTLHTAGTFSANALNGIYRHAAALKIEHSAETGSGASTLLFSHLSGNHTVFALDDGTGSIEAVRASVLLRPGVVTFVEGPTQLTLPRHRFDRPLQLALIDGPHAYPFPDLEYYYIYQHLEPGALLIVDDIQIRSINNLFEFLTEDEMFRLDEVIETTAIFRRTEADTFSPVGDGWWTQGYNRRDFEIAPPAPGESESLTRVTEATPFYLDELGPVINPFRRSGISVPALQPLLVAGWAIDEPSQRPAPWVELVLDGRAFRTNTRIPRGDVTAAHGSVRYLRCGFRTALPAERIAPGRHVLALRIAVRAGSTYFQAPDIEFVAA
jgi:hypothetical protein